MKIEEPIVLCNIKYITLKKVKRTKNCLKKGEPSSKAKYNI